MSQFVPRWSSWSPEMGDIATDKTDKSLGFKSENRSQRTDKTDKSPFVSSVSTLPAGSMGIHPPSVDSDGVAAMYRSEFADAGLVVRAFSGVLDRDVLFVSDDVLDEDIPDLGPVVFRASELVKILAWRSRLQGSPRVHRMKEILDAFGATITEIRQAGAGPLDGAG